MQLVVPVVPKRLLNAIKSKVTATIEESASLSKYNISREKRLCPLDAKRNPKEGQLLGVSFSF